MEKERELIERLANALRLAMLGKPVREHTHLAAEVEKYLATTPPNLDNLLELAKEKVNNTLKNRGGLNALSEKIAFIEGAKFIINGLKSEK